MKSLEIFSGSGGLALGLSLNGFEHEQFIEFNKNACRSLRCNFDPELVFEGDIRDFDFGKLNGVDLVAGGPPCQPFSLGGKHKANDDSRDMFPYAIKAIRKLKPKAFIFENVKGLLRKSFADYFEYILESLSCPDCLRKEGQDWREHYAVLKKGKRMGLHYQVKFKLLNAANFGVPQTRERVFIVGIRSDLNIEWGFPKETHCKEQLIYQQKKTGEYWERHSILPDAEYLETCSVISGLTQKSLFTEALKPWKTVRDAVGHLPFPKDEHLISDHIFKGGARAYPGHTGSYYDLPAKTLKAGVHGVPGGENMIRYANGEIRYFTVHEAKLIQTFPKNFMLSGAWGQAMHQIGNAVPVDLAYILGKQLRETLFEDSSFINDQTFRNFA